MNETGLLSLKRVICILYTRHVTDNEIPANFQLLLGIVFVLNILHHTNSGKYFTQTKQKAHKTFIDPHV